MKTVNIFWLTLSALFIGIVQAHGSYIVNTGAPTEFGWYLGDPHWLAAEYIRQPIL